MASCFSYSSSLDPLPLHLLHHCTSYNHLTQLHARLLRSNPTLPHNHLLSTKLLHLYSKLGRLDHATSIFNQIHTPTTFSWNLLIRAHTNNPNPQPQHALLLFSLMLNSGVPPDKFTIPFVIKACGAASAVHVGKMVHAIAVKTGYYGTDMFVKNTLIDMYIKCGDLSLARQVFDEMSVRNVVSWTTMLSGFVSCGELDSGTRLFDQMPQRNVVSWTVMMDGYVAKGRAQEAFELFARMQVEGVKPNEFTLVCLLRASTQMSSMQLGAWVHEYALKNGFELGVYLGTALVDMYSKCGSLVEARKVFDGMEKRSSATWNSMITSLGVHGCGEEALLLFERMREENFALDAITFVAVLSACVQTRKVDQGLEYFKYMTETCGIMPILEHYVCMFELWARDRSQQEGQTIKQRAEMENMFIR